MTDFETSDSVMSQVDSEIDAPIVSEDERNALKEFVIQSLQAKESTKVNREQKKQYTDSIKAIRAKLQEWIRAQESKCYMIPRSEFQKAEVQLSGGGIVSLPPFLRSQNNTSDAAITPSVIESAIMDLEESLLLEKDSVNPTDALIDCIVKQTRNLIRSTKESVALSKSMEKGMRAVDVPELPVDLCKDMVSMHTQMQKLKAINAQQKESTKIIQTRVKTLEPVVQQLLERTGRKSQQIKLQGHKGSVRIVRDQSSRSAKVTLKVFGDIVKSCVCELFSASSMPVLLQEFASKKKQLMKAVQLQVNELPKVSKTSVKLVACKETIPESDDDDDDN